MKYDTNSVTTIRLSPYQKNVLAEISNKTKINKSMIIRFALQQFFEKYEQQYLPNNNNNEELQQD